MGHPTGEALSARIDSTERRGTILRSMTNAPSKVAYLSFAPEDEPVAQQLTGILRDYLGDSVSTREFDLSAGMLVAEAISEAVSDARWFVLLVSAASLKCKWVKTEADLASIRGIEDSDFRVVFVRLDDAGLPPHLQRVLKNVETIDARRDDTRADLFLELADRIEKTSNTKSDKFVYVDRGADGDQFELLSRRNRIVFILGWAGIGKSAFAKQTVAERLRKRPLTLSLTRGHSLDLLCRQVLHQCHVIQPLGQSVPVGDEQWVTLALSALDKRAREWFLFIDNAEEAIDPVNEILPYLEKFLTALGRSGLLMHVILATTRFPQYPPEIAQWADIFRLDRMGDEYIRECIDRWLGEGPKQQETMRAPEMEELVSLISGHPLAAKLIATYLRHASPAQILESKQAKRIQLKLAEYVLSSANRTILSDIHQLILQILAVINEPVSVEDLLAVKELAGYPVDDVHKAKWELLEWFLVEQVGDVVYLPKFFQNYYRDQLGKTHSRFEAIATDYGEYALEKALALNEQLESHLSRNPDDVEEVVSVSGEIFRYAVPSARLLRAVHKHELADQLPIAIRGTARELVFYFYQDEQNYKDALKYAEQWLAVNPGDLEVMIYQVRCYRSIGGDELFLKAERILNLLERKDSNRRFAARICRERGLIAEKKGNLEEAKLHFRNGIERYRHQNYPENHIGLAQVLLRQVDELGYTDAVGIEMAGEAVKLLEDARELSATFDRYHLGTYVEALLHIGQDEKALPLLEYALKDKPDDTRLNYRMAEVLRKKDHLSAAEKFAKRALEGSGAAAKMARVTLANIHFSLGVKFQNDGLPEMANARFREALEWVQGFITDSKDVQEVADALACKIHCALGDLESAWASVYKYPRPRNPYTVYEQCRVELLRADDSAGQQEYIKAIANIRSAIERIETYRAGHEDAR